MLVLMPKMLDSSSLLWGFFWAGGGVVVNLKNKKENQKWKIHHRVANKLSQSAQIQRIGVSIFFTIKG